MYFDSYGFLPTKTLTRNFNKRKGKCVFSENKTEGKDNYGAVFCVHVIYLDKKQKWILKQLC